MDKMQTSAVSKQESLRDRLHPQFFSSSISVLSSMNSQPINPAPGPQATLTMLQLLFEANQMPIMYNASRLLHGQLSNGQKTILYDLMTQSQK